MPHGRTHLLNTCGWCCFCCCCSCGCRPSMGEYCRFHANTKDQQKKPKGGNAAFIAESIDALLSGDNKERRTAILNKLAPSSVASFAVGCSASAAAPAAPAADSNHQQQQQKENTPTQPYQQQQPHQQAKQQTMSSKSYPEHPSTSTCRCLLSYRPTNPLTPVVTTTTTTAAAAAAELLQRNLLLQQACSKSPTQASSSDAPTSNHKTSTATPASSLRNRSSNASSSSSSSSSSSVGACPPNSGNTSGPAERERQAVEGFVKKLREIVALPAVSRLVVVDCSTHQVLLLMQVLFFCVRCPPSGRHQRHGPRDSAVCRPTHAI